MLHQPFGTQRYFVFLKYTQRTGQLSLKGEQSNLEMLVFTFVVYLKQKTDKYILLIELRYLSLRIMIHKSGSHWEDASCFLNLASWWSSWGKLVFQCFYNFFDQTEGGCFLFAPGLSLIILSDTVIFRFPWHSVQIFSKSLFHFILYT